MAVITLIGKKLAKKGVEFTYKGIEPTCKKCKLKAACSSLQEGRSYKIVNVRDKDHKCPLHEENATVVEVELLPAEVNIRKEEAQGSAVAYKEIKCDNTLCEEYQQCLPGIKEKEYKIIDILDEVQCPKSYALKRVLLEDKS